MAIYTRRGDKGKTSLFNGKRVSKTNIRIEALGTIDELNSVIGVVISEAQSIKLKTKLLEIQRDLMEIAAMLANPRTRSQKPEAGSLTKRVKNFENQIDQMTNQMPKLSNFIVPGGGKAGSLLHLARTICRSAERRVVELSEKQNLDSGVIVYMNRLSDLLFTMARFVNFKERREETVWFRNG